MFESKTEYRTPPRILFVFQWRAKDSDPQLSEDPLCKEIPISWVPRAGDRVSFSDGDGGFVFGWPDDAHFYDALYSREVERAEWDECWADWVLVYLKHCYVDLERKTFVEAMEAYGWAHTDPWCIPR